ncbi:MAG: carbohydrate ABC transporter permease [Anaerolineae bacterium]|nr:carbohydrate ABC transporter permease [Anaerolineae bacterium]
MAAHPTHPATPDTGKIYRGNRIVQQRFLLTAFAVIVSLIFIWPFLVLVANTFNKLNVYMNPLIPWPKQFTLENYILAFSKYEFNVHFKNTILVVAVTALLSTLSAALAGYTLAKLQFWGRNVFFFIILAVMLLPTQTMLVPQFVVVRQLGLLNNYWGIILPGVGGFAFGIFLMRQFMLRVPTEMLEAGRIDGCNEFVLFTKLVLPTMKGPILVLATLIIRNQWNDLLWPGIIISEESKQLLIPAIMLLNNLAVADPYALIVSSAVAILAAVVPLGFYTYAQRFFVNSMTGILKG